MTTTQTILIILDKFHATTTVVAAELHQPAQVVQGFCEDAAEAGLIEDKPIGGEQGSTIHCWHITDAGRDELKRVLNEKQSAPIQQ